MAIKILLLLIFLSRVTWTFQLYGEDTGFKYFKNYTYRDYDHQPQNWAITQDKNGIIFVGNNGGVLEFDGVSWRLRYIPNNVVRSLAVSETGTIYVGGKTEFGYLSPDANGFLQYISLLDYVENQQRDFADVWYTLARGEGIYFCTLDHLFRWDPIKKRMKLVGTAGSAQRFLALFNCNEKLILHQEGTGLLEIKNDSLEPIPGSGVFAGDSIFMIAPYSSPSPPLPADTIGSAPGSAGSSLAPNQSFLVGTRARGFFLYDGVQAIPFPTGADDRLKSTRPSCGIRLSSGDFALAALRGGLIILAADGSLKYIFDKSTGLQDDNVKYVFEDCQDNLWLALDRGISKLEYASPFFYYDYRSNLPGIVLSVLRHRGSLYAGTTWGLFVLHPGAKSFQAMPGISANCRGLLSEGDLLWVASSGGLYRVDNEKSSPQVVLPDAANVLLFSRHFPGRAWCGTPKGLTILKQESGQWREDRRVDSITLPIYSLAEDEKGLLWLGTLKDSVFKLEFLDFAAPRVTGYDSSQGLPEGEIQVVFAADHVLLATAKGLFRFDDTHNRFVPDFTLGYKFAGGSIPVFPMAGGEIPGPVFRMVEDENRHIWFHSASRDFKAVPGPGGEIEILSRPFLRLPVAQVNAIYPEPGGTITWFGSIDGLIRYDAAVQKKYDREFPVFIRKARFNPTTPATGGYRIDLTPHHSPVSPAVIAYKNRNPRFYCAAAFYEDETATVYRYFLEGYDGHWSEWTRESRKDYTNLNPGTYRFRVQARNVYEKESPEAVFQFRVLPPWNRTWLAFLFYGALFMAFMFLVVKWRSRVLVKEKQKLEGIIDHRTREIHEKNTQLESQTFQLKEQAEKLKEMDNVKSRFFANISHEFRTPLTLIMGPLEQMLDRDRDPDEHKKLDVMLRNSRRLLLLINRLLDLSRFDSARMKLKASRRDMVSFLKGILASFELLAGQNRLRLEFSSPKPGIELYFDPPRLEEAVINILINAFRHTPAGGTIRVTLALTAGGNNTGCSGTGDRENPDGPDGGIDGGIDAGFLEISIADTGEGIPHDYLPLIFDRFFQVEGRHTGGQDGKGTGLGLALTKELITLHHGKIDVHSRIGTGSGTEFIIQLPLGSGHLEPGELVEPEPWDPGKPGTLPGLYAATAMETQACEPGSTPGAEMRQGGETTVPLEPGTGEEAAGDAAGDAIGDAVAEEKNVLLVVEDNADMRHYMRESLEPLYTVIEAGCGAEGIKKAREFIPDLIISDIMMPGIDGYELCRVLKGGIDTSHIPVILLTAKASEESVIQGLEIGAADYITKPFNAKILAARVKNLIELRRQFQLKIQRQRMQLPAEIPISPVDEEFLKEFQEVIKKHLADPEFDVEHLCKKLVMARSSLFKKVKALTGETPNQFIQSCRLERAAQLLRSRFGNITEVAFEVGFSSTAYFTKCFKEKFQQLPSAYQAAEAQ